MDPLRVKLWGPKHLGPSCICDLSLHPKFQSPTITPSHKKAGAAERRKKEEERRKKKNNDFNGHLVPDWLRQWGLSVSQRLRRWERVELISVTHTQPGVFIELLPQKQ